MKKTLAALAVLGAFAGTSMAADVTLYGIIDTGLTYTHTDTGVANSDAFTMESGSNSAVRFGLKGVEEIGNGLKVGFVLENGFKSDSGEFSTSGKLFDREAQVYVAGAFGQLGAGRMGQLDSGNGTYALFGGAVAPFSTGWTGVPGHKYVMSATFDRYDNMLTYKSPTFAGFNVYAQYSNGSNTNAEKGIFEGEASTDRFYALGATYKNGPLNTSLVVSQKNLKSNDGTKRWDAEDPLAVSLGGAYDFGVAKVFVATQYFKDSKLAVVALNDSWAVKTDFYTGYGINLGVSAPVLGGTAKFNVGYMDADKQPTDENGVTIAGSEVGMKRITVGAGYEYPLSKRTFVYGGAGYYQDKYDDKALVEYDDGKYVGVTAGLVHKF